MRLARIFTYESHELVGDLTPVCFLKSLFLRQRSQISADLCPAGCISCPQGDDELGLTCELIADGVRRTQDVTCGSDDEW